MEIRRSALLLHPAAGIFDLIERAEDYPQFLPWCASAVILERREDVVAARLTVDYHGVRFELVTRNPKRRPNWLAIRLEHGPFRRFEGEWQLTELGTQACRAELALHYEFGSTLLEKAAGRVFNGIANTMVGAFARRADQALPETRTGGAADAPEQGDLDE